MLYVFTLLVLSQRDENVVGCSIFELMLHKISQDSLSGICLLQTIFRENCFIQHGHAYVLSPKATCVLVPSLFGNYYIRGKVKPGTKPALD